MRVLHAHIITGIAGSESYLLKILPDLCKKGYDIHFLCIYYGRDFSVTDSFTSQLSDCGITLHYLPIGGWSYLKALFKIDQLVKQEKFDLIHTHLIHADLLISCHKRWFGGGYKLISTKHGYQESYQSKIAAGIDKRPSNLYYYAAKWSEQMFDRSYAISHSLRKLYVGVGVSKSERIDVVHYGFDFSSDNAPNAQSVPALKGGIKLVIVGRLKAIKGHLYALEALAELRAKYPDIVLTIVGDGDFRTEIEEKVSTLKLQDAVDMIGYSPKGRDYMAGADIVLIPSKSEGFGIVVLEAFSLKKPVVSFDVPALNEIISDGENGYLAAPFKVLEYKQKIEALVQNVSHRNSIGKQGFDTWKQKFTQSKMIEKTVDFYAKVMQ